MPPRSVLDIMDAQRNGAFSAQLRVWKTGGVPVNEIVGRLRDQGISVDPSTVRRWLVQVMESEPAA